MNACLAQHVVVGGVAIRGGAGSVLGVALGSVLLLVIQNGLTLARVEPIGDPVVPLLSSRRAA